MSPTDPPSCVCLPGRLLRGPPALLSPGLHLQRGHRELREAAGAHPATANPCSPPPATPHPTASHWHPPAWPRALRCHRLLPRGPALLPGPRGLLGVLPLRPGEWGDTRVWARVASPPSHSVSLRRAPAAPTAATAAPRGPAALAGAGGAAPSAGTCSDVTGDTASTTPTPRVPPPQ